MSESEPFASPAPSNDVHPNQEDHIVHDMNTNFNDIDQHAELAESRYEHDSQPSSPSSHSSESYLHSETAFSYPHAHVYCVFVGDLTLNITEEQIRAYFEQHGKLHFVHLISDKSTGTSKGYAYLYFATLEAFNKALSPENSAPVVAGALARVCAFETPTCLIFPELSSEITESMISEKVSSVLASEHFEDCFKFVFVAASESCPAHAFLSLSSSESASKCFDILSHIEIHDKPLKLVWVEPETVDKVEKPSASDSSLSSSSSSKVLTLHVSNISPTCTEEQLIDFFSKFGPVSQPTIAKGSHGDNRGYGFVTLPSHDLCTAAIKELDRTELAGQKLFITFARHNSGHGLSTGGKKLKAKKDNSRKRPKPYERNHERNHEPRSERKHKFDKKHPEPKRSSKSERPHPKYRESRDRRDDRDYRAEKRRDRHAPPPHHQPYSQPAAPPPQPPHQHHSHQHQQPPPSDWSSYPPPPQQQPPPRNYSQYDHIDYRSPNAPPPRDAYPPPYSHHMQQPAPPNQYPPSNAYNAPQNSNPHSSYNSGGYPPQTSSWYPHDAYSAPPPVHPAAAPHGIPPSAPVASSNSYYPQPYEQYGYQSRNDGYQSRTDGYQSRNDGYQSRPYEPPRYR